MSKYYNMNDLQCHWQNPSRTNPAFSDANQHSQSYCALSAFMTAPSCFMLTQLLKPEEREELKAIIKIYKENRKDIFESFVFPIADEPNNASWTGFQMHHPNSKTGYLMIFRELRNQKSERDIQLKFLYGNTIKLIDLERPDKIENVVLKESAIKFHIPEPAGYRFLRYEILD
jgi:hypothetical protein